MMKGHPLSAGKKLLVASIFAFGLLPAPRSTADELPLNELSARWWQVVLSIPTSVNPITDTTGEDCMVGQRGDVWFLHGTFLGGTAERECSVPADKPLFFPVINNVILNTPGDCGQPRSQVFTVADERALVAPLIDSVTTLSVTLDGHPITDYERVKSVPFVAALPADNIFATVCDALTPPGQPAGIFSPAVDDGYYVLLQPLHRGVHHLHIAAAAPGFSVDVTYTLTVVPVSLH